MLGWGLRAIKLRRGAAIVGAISTIGSSGCGSSSSTASSDGGDATGMFAGEEATGDTGLKVDATLDGVAAEAGDELVGEVDALVDGGSIDAAPISCGDASCKTGQLCEYQTGGPGPLCSSLDDAGGCPVPLLYMSNCPSLGGRPGCYTNAPPFPLGCVAIPATCDAALSCQCLSPDPCGATCPCAEVQDGTILCGCP